MHFLVHNSIMFTVVIMGLVHTALLGITWYSGITPLARFNTVSVIVYLLCTILCKFGRITPVYISILLEVSAYASVSVYYIGWDSGSYYFLFSIVPIIIYLGSFLYRGARRWMIIALSLTLDYAVFAILYMIFYAASPVIEVSHATNATLTIFSSFAMFFSVVFYNLIYIYSSEDEVTSLEHENEQLSVDANNDTLTSLLNRRGFLPLTEALMEDERSHFCIAFIDIDNFKQINDSYGHDCGDTVLKHISKTFKKEMYGCPICRWGGEEIVILMKDYDMTVARQKMEYIRSSIENSPVMFYNKRIRVTITVGLAEYEDSHHTPDDIIKIADERMYYGKQHGKNMIIYKDME